MAQKPPPDRDLGRLFALGQTGLEMAAPIALGMYLDNRFGWSPWATAIGAVIGLAGGLAHMLYMLNRSEQERTTEPPRGPK